MDNTNHYLSTLKVSAADMIVTGNVDDQNPVSIRNLRMNRKNTVYDPKVHQLVINK